MVRWITGNLGTGKKDEVDDQMYSVVDVRDLVDREGNSKQSILAKIDVVVELLNQEHQVVVCCDYGMSRSNSIAIGAIVKYLNYSFDEAIKLVMEKTGEKAINIGMLNSVRYALVDKDNLDERKKILITGGTGFIGRALKAELKKKYDLVIPSHKELDLLDGTINFDSLVKSNGVGTIIHLANPRVYTVAESMGQSIVMLKNVLDVCKENRLNLLYPSTWMVYSGYATSHLVALESLSLCPKGTYAETKTLCENLVNHYRDFYGLNIGLLRLSPVYGVGGDKPKFIYNFFQKARRNETIFTHKYLNGFPKLDLLYIDDVVRAIGSVLDAQPSYSFDLNIGPGIGHSTYDIAKMIKEMCNSSSEIIHNDINDFVSNIVIDASKAKRVFGWESKVNMQDGLKNIMNNGF